jgi:hypothetical protein
MGKKDYLPSNTLKFQNMVHNIRAQVTVNQARWDISQTLATSLDPLIANFDAAVVVSENPETRTQAAVERRDRTRSALEEVLRPFIQGQLIHNLLVTSDDLVAMGLPVHDRHPSPAPDPDEEPELEATTPSPGVVEIKFHRKDGRGKPDKTQGIELRWLVSETPPVDWAELTHSEFATRSPLRLTFEGHDRGKWIHFAARWENTRGVKGKWTEIFSAVIP